MSNDCFQFEDFLFTQLNFIFFIIIYFYALFICTFTLASCVCVHACAFTCMHHSQADPESADVKENVDGAEEKNNEEKVGCVREKEFCVVTVHFFLALFRSYKDPDSRTSHFVEP